MSIADTYRSIREEVPEHVTIVAAAKTRSVDEVKALIDAGVSDIGENYVQEAEQMRSALGSERDRVRWHLLGHLQVNKVNKALQHVAVIQTLDSLKLARAIDRRAQAVVPVLVEINSGREPQKTGFLPDDAEEAIREMAGLEHIAIKGLMTMGPRFGDPENARPYFQTMKRLHVHIASLGIPGVRMEALSMGMSNSYRVAIEEGSTMIRIGTILFGKRPSCSLP